MKASSKPRYPPTKSVDKDSNKPHKKQYQQAKNKGEVGADPSLPVLHWGGKDNNFAHFRRELETKAVREFGNLGSLIKTGMYYEPPEIEYDAEALDPAKDKFGFARKRVDVLIAERAKLEQKFEQDKPKLCAMIWGNLSNESKQKIKEHEDWELIELLNDPLMLWLAIVHTHRTSIVGDKLLDIEIANSRFTNIYQQPYESFVDYKHRFDDCVEVLEALEIQKSDEELAIHFIQKLDGYRYGDFKTLPNYASAHWQQARSQHPRSFYNSAPIS